MRVVLNKMSKRKPLVGIVCGSTSDIIAIEDALKILDELEVPYTLDIKSAHRLPDDMIEYAKEAESRGLKVIIAAAGGAVGLSGMIAAYTILPVIGLPIKTSDLSGIDSLLSIVQMPNGVPVGTMGINRGKNAAIYAVEILALYDDAIRRRLRDYRVKAGSLTRVDAEKRISEIKSGTHPYML